MEKPERRPQRERVTLARPPRRQVRACGKFLEKFELIPRTMSQGDACRAAGIPANQITRWREGRPLRLDHVFLLARQLGVSIDWWADDAQQGPPEGASEAMRRILDVVRELGPDVAYKRLIQAPEPVAEPATVRGRQPGPSRKARPQGDDPARRR